MRHWVPDKWWGEYRAAAQLCPPQISYKLTTRLNADLRDHGRQLNRLIPGTTFQALLRHSSYYFASSAVSLCADFQVVCPQIKSKGKRRQQMISHAECTKRQVMYKTRWRSAKEMATGWLSVPVLNLIYKPDRPRAFLGQATNSPELTVL